MIESKDVPRPNMIGDGATSRVSPLTSALLDFGGEGEEERIFPPSLSLQFPSAVPPSLSVPVPPRPRPPTPPEDFSQFDDDDDDEEEWNKAGGEGRCEVAKAK